MSDLRNDELFESLAVFGSDVSRWPEDCTGAARRALLGQPEFRREWDAARALDAALAEERDRIDRAVEESGAMARIGRRTLARIPSNPLAGMRWQRIAAAVLVAGMVGGAMDLLVPVRAADALDVVMLDPLDSDVTDIR